MTKQTTVGFGEVISALKEGKAARRQGWNGNGIYIELQVPDAFSKMSQPYIFIKHVHA
jgi:hypothetical protein